VETDRCQDKVPFYVSLQIAQRRFCHLKTHHTHMCTEIHKTSSDKLSDLENAQNTVFHCMESSLWAQTRAKKILDFELLK